MADCPHCGDPLNTHSGPCRQQLAVLYADQRIEAQAAIASRDLHIASLEWQHMQDEMEFGSVRRFHA